jgi:prepilin-type N-terminal cleavage/methylation domain-containing protein
VKDNRGLTIIEVLIAMAVVGVVFVALASLQISSIRVTADARSDSDLLAQAVTTFESARTIVLRDFAGYLAACTAASPSACTDAPLAALVDADRIELSAASFGTPPVPYPGLLRLRIDAVDVRSDRTLTLVQYVSCLDGDDVPLITDPIACGVSP